jgi:microsomal epoxide hydrolase
MVRSIFHKPHSDLDIQHVIEESMKTPPSIVMAMWMADIFGVDRRPALKKINRRTLVIAFRGISAAGCSEARGGPPVSQTHSSIGGSTHGLYDGISKFASTAILSGLPGHRMGRLAGRSS